MPTNTHTKILATVGPATDSREMLEKLIDAGADAFRFNFSHGTHEEHKQRYNIVRELSESKGKHITIVADLQGPKLRVGCFENKKANLKSGSIFVLDMDETLGNEQRVCLPHKEIFEAVKPNDVLLLNDGNISLEVVSVEDKKITTQVITGGVLSDHKGVNLPNITLPISALTEKDRRDLDFALEIGIDWISLSFVQKVQDVKEVKDIVGDRALVMSKLEKPSAIDDLEEIIKLSDGVMVARGDLGVECPLYTVPVLQKRILSVCRKYGKPAVVATQMLESMIEMPTPTRAEVSDVATAVYEGADTVMLSAETAVGKYPEKTVKMMRSIIEQVEEDESFFICMGEDAKDFYKSETMGITYAANELAQVLPNVGAIVTYTASGYTTFSMAKERPDVHIIAITPSVKVARRLGIVWGVHSYVNEDVFLSFERIEDNAAQYVKENGYGKSGEIVIVTAGYPFGKVGMTNLLHTIKIP